MWICVVRRIARVCKRDKNEKNDENANPCVHFMLRIRLKGCETRSQIDLSLKIKDCFNNWQSPRVDKCYPPPYFWVGTIDSRGFRHAREADATDFGSNPFHKAVNKMKYIIQNGFLTWHALNRRYVLSLGRGGLVLLLMAIGVLAASPGCGHSAEADIWDALETGGHFVMLRHAMAPGTGDPAGFTLGDCSTQRNLSEAGRAQADAIGARFRQNGITTARVFSSQWCRCLETAARLKLGPVTELPALNSFFGRYALETPRTETLKAWLNRQELTTPLVLVTHQVNITALTGVYPSSGEMVVLHHDASAGLTVVGTIQF